MARLVFVRHGETEWNRDRRVQGWAPVALTDHGHRQAQQLAERLADQYTVDRLVSSDLRRTLETARPIGRTVGCEVQSDRRWRERNFGVLQGLEYGELFLGHPEFTLSEVGYTAADARPEGGESLIDQRERILEAMTDLKGTLDDDETVVIVTHGGPLYLILGWARGLDIRATILDQEQGNCAINELVVGSSDRNRDERAQADSRAVDIEVVVENDTEHLDSERA